MTSYHLRLKTLIISIRLRVILAFCLGMVFLIASCSADANHSEAIPTLDGGNTNADAREDATDIRDSAQIAQLILSPDPVEAFVTQTIQVDYRVYRADGSQIDDATVEWQVEDAEIATVNAQGEVRALAAGQTTLIAISGDTRAWVEVTVLPLDALGRIEIIPAIREVGVGESLNLTLKAYRVDDTNVPALNLPVEWQSDTPERAAIDANGLLVGLKRGNARIRASVGGLRAQADFRVELKFKTFAQSDTSFAISTAGEIYSIWFNDSHENSDGLWMPKIEKIETEDDLRFKSVSTKSGASNCALTEDGQVYCWGQNIMGTLGVDFQTSYLESPTLLETELRFESLAMGQYATCGLTDAGSIYCWGDLLISGNWQDRGPDPFVSHSFVPEFIDVGPFARIFMTRNSLCAEETKTKRWRCMGSGESGVLGNGSLDDQDELVAIDEPGVFLEMAASNDGVIPRGICGIDEQYHIWCWGGGLTSAPQRKPWSDKMVDITHTGRGHCSATLERDIKCWGELSPCSVGRRAYVPNSERTYYDVPQAAIENIPEDWVALADRCVLTEGGDIWCWGLPQSTGNPVRPLECEPSAQRVQTF